MQLADIVDSMELVPGVGLGPIKLGMTPEEIRSILGPETASDATATHAAALIWPGIEITFGQAGSKENAKDRSAHTIVAGRALGKIIFFC